MRTFIIRYGINQFYVTDAASLLEALQAFETATGVPAWQAVPVM